MTKLDTPATHPYQAAAAFVRRRTGLDVQGARWWDFCAALDKLAASAPGGDPGEYLARLDADPALLDDLISEITVGETYFFRESGQLEVLRRTILPQLQALIPDRPLRIWSAGCATGEEPYTVAILAHQDHLVPRPHILGTDLSRAALAKARRAVYSRWSMRSTPDDLVPSYFERREGRYHLAPAIRDAVEFRYLNLVEDAYPSPATGAWAMDVILCRNVLIYHDPDSIARIAGRLVGCLSEHGWLLLGACDPQVAEVVACEVVVTEAGLAYRRPSGRSTVAVTGPSQSSPALASDGVPDAAPALFLPPTLAPTEVTEPLAQPTDSHAASHTEPALRRDGGDAGFGVTQIRALANAGRLSEAGRECAAALDLHRESAELMYLHAVLLSEGDRPIEAAAAARRALYLDGSLVVAHLTLGAAMARLQDRPAARRAFRNAERLLAAMSPDALVPASEDEPAGRLLAIARAQLELMDVAAA
jgi:chemotaxis protein methyltransferase CheR